MRSPSARRRGERARRALTAGACTPIEAGRAEHGGETARSRSRSPGATVESASAGRVLSTATVSMLPLARSRDHAVRTACWLRRRRKPLLAGARGLGARRRRIGPAGRWRRRRRGATLGGMNAQMSCNHGHVTDDARRSSTRPTTPPATRTASRARARARARAKNLCTTFGCAQLRRQQQPDSAKPGEVHGAGRGCALHRRPGPNVCHGQRSRGHRHPDRHSRGLANPPTSSQSAKSSRDHRLGSEPAKRATGNRNTATGRRRRRSRAGTWARSSTSSTRRSRRPRSRNAGRRRARARRRPRGGRRDARVRRGRLAGHRLGRALARPAVIVSGTRAWAARARRCSAQSVRRDPQRRPARPGSAGVGVRDESWRGR